MKQVIQPYKTAALEVADVPAPAFKADTLLVRTEASPVSVGTKRYMLELGNNSLLGKALAHSHLVKQVVNKVRSDGLAEAYSESMGLLDSPVPLGDNASGVVVAVGDGVTGFAEGDRVACTDSGIARHAEFLRVPRTLAARIPADVSFEAASFVALGGTPCVCPRSRLVRVVVLGLGLLGQLAVQIGRSAACRVCGLDVARGKVGMTPTHQAMAVSCAQARRHDC